MVMIFLHVLNHKHGLFGHCIWFVNSLLFWTLDGMHQMFTSRVLVLLYFRYGSHRDLFFFFCKFVEKLYFYCSFCVYDELELCVCFCVCYLMILSS